MKAESHPDRLGAAKAWLVTGPLGRAFAFALDFAAALRTLVRKPSDG